MKIFGNKILLFFLLMLFCAGKANGVEPRCRIGAGIPWSQQEVNFSGLSEKGVCQVFDWGAFEVSAKRALENGIKYYPMVWSCKKNTFSSTTQANFKKLAEHFPGLTYFMFNEPDLAGQADCTPQDGAETYYLATQTILKADPTAKFACCGEYYLKGNFIDNMRLEYNRLYGEYPKIDFLHIHLYPQIRTNNGDFYDRFETDKLKAWFTSWETWRSTGWAKNVPVFLSEFGPLTMAYWDNCCGQAGSSGNCCSLQQQGYTSEVKRIADYYMPNMMPWLLSKNYLLGIFWFSSYNDQYTFAPSNLCKNKYCNEENGGILTYVGEKYFSYGIKPTPTPVKKFRQGVNQINWSWFLESKLPAQCQKYSFKNNFWLGKTVGYKENLGNAMDISSLHVWCR